MLAAAALLMLAGVGFVACTALVLNEAGKAIEESVREVTLQEVRARSRSAGSAR